MHSNFDKEFHTSRIAFMIINNEILYLENSEMSHKEWYISLELNLDNFDNIIRGYVKDNKIVYYKGDFTYDEEVINITVKTMNQIKNETNNINAEVYVGVNKGNPNEEWKPIQKIDSMETPNGVFSFILSIIIDKNSVLGYHLNRRKVI